MRQIAVWAAAGLAIAGLIILGTYFQQNAAGQAVASTSQTVRYESSRELYNRLRGTPAACQPYSPTTPLHEALDAANCRIQGVMATLSIYDSSAQPQREIKAFEGRGAGRYEGLWIARLTGANWMVAVGGYDRDDTQRAAEAAQVVLGGEIDYKGWD